MHKDEINRSHLAQVHALELDFFDYASYQTDGHGKPIRGIGRRTLKGGKTVDAFDEAHRRLWANCDVALKASTG